MDSKDIELKSALDEIFGDDIIELDDDIPVVEKKEPTNEELFENTSTLILNPNDFVKPNEEIIENDIEVSATFNDAMVDSPLTSIPNPISDINNSIPESSIIETNNTLKLKEDKEIIESSSDVLTDFSIPVLDIKNDTTETNVNFETKEILEENIEVSEEIKQEKSLNIPITKVIIISVIVVLLTLGGVYFGINFFGNKDKTVVCSYVFDDTNYKITDEYKISYQNKKITYIEGVYMYTSKTDEYDEQIKYIKEDKLPAIINSNGMKGFTYTYENTDDSIKISSYLDYTIMDEKEIKSIDQKAAPISYFEVDLDNNSENLTKLFKKQGYKCTSRK